jgi:cytidylate kinase
MLALGELEKARLYVESHSKEEEKKLSGPCITISRETGAGADQVSIKLLEFLQPHALPNSPKFTIFDKNLIEKVISDHNLPRSIEKLMDEKKYSSFITIAADITGQPDMWMLKNKTSQTIYQLGQLGNVIIIGRGSNVVTERLKNAFHVRLIAPIENRVKHIEEIFGMKRKDAEDYIKTNDTERRKYLKSFFNKEIDNPLLYHITVNTGLFSYHSAAQLIADIVLKSLPGYFSK